MVPSRAYIRECGGVELSHKVGDIQQRRYCAYCSRCVLCDMEVPGVGNGPELFVPFCQNM